MNKRAIKNSTALCLYDLRQGKMTVAQAQKAMKHNEAKENFEICEGIKRAIEIHERANR